ncbi:DNA polymerase III subunit delta [Bacillus timonensis]|nr:DNA polymerase III subunit delta [Bacillus timonensis]
MNVNVWKKIKKKEFSSIYLLYGTENFLINETKELIVNGILPEEERDFNLSQYDLEETAIEVALEDAETLPFMGEKRVIIVKNPYFLTAEKGKEKVEHNIQKLEEYIKAPSPYSHFIIIAPYEKLDERKKITKLLKKEAETVETNSLSDSDLRLWINERTTINQVTISNAAVQKLLQLTGSNLMVITNEVDKLSLYVGQYGEIDEEVVRLLVARSLEQNIFELIEHAVNRKLSEALRIFYDLLNQNEEPIKILSLLASQFRLIYGVKELSQKGYGQQQIATTLKVHPFRVKLAAGQAKMFSSKELTNIIEQLAEADFDMKNGKMDKQLILELFLMKLAN